MVATGMGSYTGKVVILACGSSLKHLDVPGESDFEGRGVSYCATCDGDHVSRPRGGRDRGWGFRHGRSALPRRTGQPGHRRPSQRPSACHTGAAGDGPWPTPRSTIRWQTLVEGIEGDTQVERLRLKDVRTGEPSFLPVAGVFIYVGLRPNTDFLHGVLPLDAGGHVVVNQRMETEIPGLYAAGDLRQYSARQVISAAGDGATAAFFAIQHLRSAG